MYWLVGENKTRYMETGLTGPMSLRKKKNENFIVHLQALSVAFHIPIFKNVCCNWTLYTFYTDILVIYYFPKQKFRFQALLYNVYLPFSVLSSIGLRIENHTYLGYIFLQKSLY